MPGDLHDAPDSNEESDSEEEEDVIRVEGVKGKFVQALSMNDKYDQRPDDIESITLSQFATSYTKCPKRPKMSN